MEGGKEAAGEAPDITRLLGGRFLPSPRTSLIAGEGGAAASDEDILEASLKSEITDSKHETKNSVCYCVKCQQRSA